MSGVYALVIDIHHTPQSGEGYPEFQVAHIGCTKPLFVGVKAKDDFIFSDIKLLVFGNALKGPA